MKSVETNHLRRSADLSNYDVTQERGAPGSKVHVSEAGKAADKKLDSHQM